MLVDDGVATLADLAALNGAAVEGMDAGRLARLRDQAALQVQARALPDSTPPPFAQIPSEDGTPGGHGHALLPAPDDGDVFLDFEGHPLWRPDGGLFFLFGFLARARTASGPTTPGGPTTSTRNATPPSGWSTRSGSGSRTTPGRTSTTTTTPSGPGCRPCSPGTTSTTPGSGR